MSRIAQNILPLTLATVCGVATAYVTLQPVLEEQKEERETTGAFAQTHDSKSATTTQQTQSPPQINAQAVESRVKDQESAISRAIMQDFKEAGQQVRNSGVGWGFRNLWAGRKWDEKEGVGHDGTDAVEGRKG